MFLIFGVRVYYRTVGQGTFHCQRCGGDRPYRRRSGWRFIHVFFIPIVPLGKVGEHVQCTVCRTRYRTEVLELPTMAQMQAAHPAGMRAAAVAMLRASGSGSLAARRRAIEAISGAGLAGYDDAALEADLADLGDQVSAAQDVAARLNALARQLAVPAREWFLAEIVRIGLADGALTESERRAVQEIAAQLGMTPAQAIGVITMTEEGASAG